MSHVLIPAVIDIDIDIIATNGDYMISLRLRLVMDDLFLLFDLQHSFMASANFALDIVFITS